MSSSTYPIDYKNYFNKIRGEAIYNAGLSQDMKVYSEALAAIEDLIFYDQLDAMDSLDKTSYGKLLGIGGLAEQYGKSKIEFEEDKLILFDAKKPHKGNAPKKGNRITLAFKTEII